MILDDLQRQSSSILLFMSVYRELLTTHWASFWNQLSGFPSVPIKRPYYDLVVSAHH